MKSLKARLQILQKRIKGESHNPQGPGLIHIYDWIDQQPMQEKEKLLVVAAQLRNFYQTQTANRIQRCLDFGEKK